MTDAASPPNLLPVVGIVCNLKLDEQFRHQFRHHTTGERNILAISRVAGAVPLLVPALGNELCLATLLSTFDGLMLTGGISNIEPHHYGQEPAPGEDVRDPGRDHLSFALVREAVRLGVPLLGVCRGIQEMNVAFGGTLHQRLHEVEGRHDHRRNKEIAFEESIAPREHVRLTAGGRLAEWFGAEEAIVNSLHGQGIDRLAPGLEVEAVAVDGTIEAIVVRDAPTFAIGVQWHVEIDAETHPLNRAILEAFGEAVHARAAARRENVAAVSFSDAAD